MSSSQPGSARAPLCSGAGPRPDVLGTEGLLRLLRHAGSLGLLTVLGLLGPSADSTASAATSADSVALEEVVITAQRRTESLQQAPLAVSALGATALEDRALGSIADLAVHVPNAEFNQGRADSGGSALALYIRGVGQSDWLFPNDPGVGLYLDGVYVSRAVGANLDLFDVERVEVLRGPQGTLYGKNTIGGAVNVISIAPDLADSSGLVRATIGRHGRRDVGGYLTLPLVTDRLGVKISALTTQRDGFMRRESDGLDLGDVDRDAVRAALRWRPGDVFEATLAGDYTRIRENGAPGTLLNVVPSENLVGAPLPDVTPTTPLDLIDFYNLVAAPVANARAGLPADSRFDGRWVNTDRSRNRGTQRVGNASDTYGIALTVQAQIAPAASLKSITAYRHTESDFAQDSDFSPYDVISTDNEQTQQQLSQELQLSLALLDGRLDWVSGLFYMHERANDENLVLILDPLTELLQGGVNLDWRPLAKLEVDTYAVFSQATYALTDALRLTLGGRWSRDEKTLEQGFRFQTFPYVDPFGNTTLCYTCLEDGVTPRTLAKRWSAFTPRVAVDYRASDDHLLYASWSRGFKSGGWSPRPTPDNRAETPFDPEYLSTLELGSKSSFLDRRVNVNVAAFASEYRDVQLTLLGAAFNLVVTNAAKNRLYGLELEVAARPVPDLDLNASLGLLRNEYDELSGSDPQLSRDDELPDAPEVVGSLGAQYSFGLGAAGELRVRADASYRGKTWKDPYNLRRDAVLQFAGAPVGAVPVVDGVDGYRVAQRTIAQDAYWLANARVAFVSRRGLEIAAFVTNVFDEEYYTSILPVTAFGSDIAYFGRPREWGLSLSYRF